LVGVEVNPVPPDVTPSVPANVTAPVVAVVGVRPDNEVWNDVTSVPEPTRLYQALPFQYSRVLFAVVKRRVPAAGDGGRCV